MTHHAGWHSPTLHIWAMIWTEKNFSGSRPLHKADHIMYLKGSIFHFWVMEHDTALCPNPFYRSTGNLVNRQCSGVYFRKAIFCHFMKVWKSGWSCCHKTRHIILLDKGSPLEVSHCWLQGIFLLKTKCWPFWCGFSDFCKWLIRFLKIILIRRFGTLVESSQRKLISQFICFVLTTVQSCGRMKPSTYVVSRK